MVYHCQLQIQFVAIISHTSYNKFVRTDCDYPYLYNSITFYYTWSMMALFLHFFYFTYLRARRSRQVQPENGQLKSNTTMKSNGHVVDNRNGDSRKPPDADFAQNNNSVADASRERKEQ